MRDHSEESFSDGTPVPAEEPPAGKGKGPSQAQILVGMAEDTYRLIRADDGRAYAVPRLGPQIAVPLASKSENSLRTRLAASLHRQTGQVASSSNLSDAITVLMGEAADLEPVPVWLRAARHDGTVVIDMGTGTGQCIIITGRGWSVEPGSPVIFRRSELTHPLAEPQRGGTLDGLRELINLPEDDYRLAIGWVIAAYFTGIPHPILLVQGEQGTAKSGLIRTLLALVDPQPAAERTPPKDQREWAIFGRASWAFSYDNITDIPPWLSNALCKGVTGDAVLQRVLHSDEDIGVYSFQRVIALTTIAIGHDLAGDLADRTLLIEPEVIEVRRDEEDIQAARAAALPSALGAVLDLVAGVLAELPAHDGGQRAADGRLRQSPRRPRRGHRLGHPGQLPGQGRQPGPIPDRGQHPRPRPLPARHRPQPRRPGPGPVGRHRHRTARRPARNLHRRRPARLRPARRGTRPRAESPRDRPVPAQSRRRYPARKTDRAPAPADHQQNRARQ